MFALPDLSVLSNPLILGVDLVGVDGFLRCAKPPLLFWSVLLVAVTQRY
jgi:hypothetical protein